jgi:hypothetical protein
MGIAKLSIAALLVLPGVSCAQDRRGEQPLTQERGENPGIERPQHRNGDESQDKHGPRRLETITWNSVRHEFTWVISNGEKQDAGYKPLSQQNYNINMDKATMTFNGETRRFSKQEAQNVHALMDLISKYAVDSTIWWDQGNGEPLNGSDKDKDIDSPAPPEQKKKDLNEPKETIRVALPHGASLRDVRIEINDLERRLEQLRKVERELSLHVN